MCTNNWGIIEIYFEEIVIAFNSNTKGGNEIFLLHIGKLHASQQYEWK